MRIRLFNQDQHFSILFRAGGMRMGRPEFLQQLRRVADQFNTLLIFDEVMTGFGRTGDWFACAKAQVEPDIICLSKGLTGGFLPFAVTVCSEAFYSDDPLKTRQFKSEVQHLEVFY